MASIGRLAALNGTCCEESQETMKSELHQVFYRESQENGINIRCGSHHIRDKFSLQEDENRPYHHFEIDFPTKVSKDVVDMRVKLILKRLMGRTEHIVYPCKVAGTTHSFFNVLPMDLKSSLEELLADDEEAQQALSVVCQACMQGTRAGELTSIARTSIRLKLCVHMMCTCRYVVLQENQNWKCLYQEVKNFLRKDLKGDKQTIREAQRTLMKAGEAISTSDGRLETGTNPRLSFDPRQDASASRGTSKRQRDDGLQDDDVSPRSLVRPKMVPGDGSGDTSEQNASDEGAFDTSPDSVLPQPTCQGTPAAESLPGFNGILPRRPDNGVQHDALHLVQPEGKGSGVDLSSVQGYNNAIFDGLPDSILPQPTCQETPVAESLLGVHGLVDDDILQNSTPGTPLFVNDNQDGFFMESYDPFAEANPFNDDENRSL